ncbi:MAG: LuxR C-terminal-related transcriptional regulator [Longimicrobiales bacterium]
MTAIDTIRRGRECFARRRWADAYTHLSAADQEASLEPDDLERLATAAYLVGRDSEQCLRGLDRMATGAAFYQRAELHRLHGEFGEAEDAYRQASRWGRRPQPGLALLRLAQGQGDAAGVAVRGLVEEARERRIRSKLLPAHVEIMLAVGDVQAARVGANELEEIADEDTADMEVDAACWTFQQLGAAPDLARLEERARKGGRAAPGGLTTRELQVLRLVATGMTNQAIATELFISPKTVARHVSNIFGKLRLSTRAAATAYAHQHNLV